MKLFKLFIICIGTVLVCSSCSVVKHHSYSPDTVKLNLTMNDLEYLGEVTISVQYSKYLGFIRHINTINGKSYKGDVIQQTSVCGCTDPVLQRAANKVFDVFPGAEYVVVSSERTDVTRLFLGGEVSVSAKVKAYKFK